jgi:hypothetical protein
MRRIELEADGVKEKLPDKLDVAKNTDNLNSNIKAVLNHMTREKEKN